MQLRTAGFCFVAIIYPGALLLGSPMQAFRAPICYTASSSCRGTRKPSRTLVIANLTALYIIVESWRAIIDSPDLALLIALRSTLGVSAGVHPSSGYRVVNRVLSSSTHS